MSKHKVTQSKSTSAQFAAGEHGGATMSSTRRAKSGAESQQNTSAANNAVLDTLLLWRSQLEKLTNVRSNSVAHTLNLANAHPGGLAQLYAEHPTRLSNLVREPRALEAAQQKARRLMAYAATMEAVHGQCTIHLALGKVSWTQPASIPAWDAVNQTSPQTAGTTKNPTPSTAPAAQTAPTANAPSNKKDEHFVSAALMRPVEVGEDNEGNITLQLKPGTTMGPTLAQALTAHGVNADPNHVFAPALTSHGFAPSLALSAIKDAGRVLDHFEVKDVLEVGVFIHPAHVLLADYDQIPVLLANPLVRAAAGDNAAAALTKHTLPPANPNDRDPWKEPGVGDLTPQQQDIVEAAAQGTSLVVDVPPDSPDVAVLTAIAADRAAQGKHVVHVAGSANRIRAVEDYIRQLSLPEVAAHVGLHVPNRLANRSDLAVRLERALADTSSVVDPAEIKTMRTRLVEVRQALSGYTATLHRPFGRFGVSAFDALQALTDLTNARPSPRTRVRLKEDVLAAIAQDQGARARSLLHRACQLGIFSAQADRSGWAGAVINSEEQVPKVMGHVHQLSEELLPKMRVQMAAIAGETGLKVATSLEEWEKQLRMLEGVREVLDVFKPAIFERSAADMVIATASKQWRREHGIAMKRSQRNRLVKQAQDFVLPGRHVEDLHHELLLVQDRREAWRRQCDSDGWPVLPTRLDEAIATAQQVRKNADRLSPMLSTSHHDLMRMDITAVADLLERLASDPAGARKLPQRVAVLKDITLLGLEQLSADFKARHISESMIDSEVDLAWWASLLGIMMADQPELGGMDPTNLESLLEEGRDLDRRQVASLVPQTIDQIRRQRRQILATQPESAERLRRALDAGTPDIPLVQSNPMVWDLIPIIHTVATAVPKLFGPLTRHSDAPIDVLILDGVDQLSMGELAPVIARAQQVILFADLDAARVSPSPFAGHEAIAASVLAATTAQPTSFPAQPSAGLATDAALSTRSASTSSALSSRTAETNAALSTRSAATSAVSGFRPATAISAVLAEALPVCHLRPEPGHLNDSVARLLSQHGLVLGGIPTPFGVRTQPVTAVWCDGTGMPAPGTGAVESSQVEVNQVVAAVLDHAQNHPDQSLSVIALNDLHADRIRQALNRQIEHRPELVDFFDRSKPDPFVVVGPQRARQASRSRVIVTLGYAKTPHGRVIHDFGQISTAAGARLMAQVLQSIRGDLTVVSSIRPEDLDRNRLNSEGLIMLLELLEIAQGAQPLATGDVVWPVLEQEPDRLLVDLAERLYSMGLEVVPNLGSADGVRIPLAIGHPEVPGRLLLAVITDDDTYIQQPSLRVRDRFWPAQLRQQGWHVRTELSMAVFIDPEREAQAIVGELLDAVDEINGPLSAAQAEQLSQVSQDSSSVSDGSPQFYQSADVPSPSTDAAATNQSGEVAHTDGQSDQPEANDLSDSDRARERRDELETGMMDLRSLQAKQEESEESDQPPRGPRPSIAKGLPLAAYGDDQLDEMAHWVRSDGVERSVDEVAEQLRLAIGLRHRGLQTDAVLRNVARRTQPAAPAVKEPEQSEVSEKSSAKSGESTESAQSGQSAQSGLSEEARGSGRSGRRTQSKVDKKDE